jgi:hypothetical protein
MGWSSAASDGLSHRGRPPTSAMLLAGRPPSPIPSRTGGLHVTRNPYAPPTAPVADVSAAGSPLEVDPHVLRACTMMWWSFGMSFLGFCLQLVRGPGTRSVVGAAVGATVGGAIVFLITRWITSKLRAGRNWMRLLLTGLQLAGIALIPLFWDFYKAFLLHAFTDNFASGVITAIQWALSISAVVLINMPGARSWFATMSRGAHAARSPRPS